jgi:hypothetical protein
VVKDRERDEATAKHKLKVVQEKWLKAANTDPTVGK